jgi:ASC-1-like (ASCH) protein
MFLAKKEVFEWLSEGKKTIDVRKGRPRMGDVAVFACGPRLLKLRIVGTQTGKLTEVIRADNFRQVIPAATTLDEALAYLRRIYGSCEGCFTAYTVVP